MHGAATGNTPNGMMPWFNMFNGTNQSSWGMPFGQGGFFNGNLVGPGGIGGMGGVGMAGMMGMNPINMSGMGNVSMPNPSMVASTGQQVGPQRYPNNTLPNGGHRSSFPRSNHGSSGATPISSRSHPRRQQHRNSAAINLTPQDHDFGVTQHKGHGSMQLDRFSSTTSTTSFDSNPFEVPTASNPRRLPSAASDSSDFAGSVKPLGSSHICHRDSLRGGSSARRPQ